jgi:hypothetical protein
VKSRQTAEAPRLTGQAYQIGIFAEPIYNTGVRLPSLFRTVHLWLIDRTGPIS